MNPNNNNEKPPIGGVKAVSASHSEKSFLALAWEDARPYIVIILADFLISVALWLSLWTFHFLTKYVKLTGYSAKMIEAIHGAGSVAAFGLFIGLFIFHIWKHFTNGASE